MTNFREYKFVHSSFKSFSAKNIELWCGKAQYIHKTVNLICSIKHYFKLRTVFCSTFVIHTGYQYMYMYAYVKTFNTLSTITDQLMLKCEYVYRPQIMY